MRVVDIDFERDTIFVHRGKGAKDRYIPIGERAVSSVGTLGCADWLCRKVRWYLRHAGIDKRGSCHLLRHSVATVLLEGGTDIRYGGEMLGHAPLEGTRRDTRVSIDRLRSVQVRSHPATGLDVAMAAELCSMLPEGSRALNLSGGRAS